MRSISQEKVETIMKNLFVIDGASGTGKSDLLQYVDNFKTKVSIVRKYTTRSQRDYEKEKSWKLDLDFISQEDFDQQKFDYQYKYGKQMYGFHRVSLDTCLKQHSNVFVIVRNTDVIKQLIEDYNFINVVPVYIYTDQEKIQQRLIAQNVTEEQLKFRLDRIREAFEDYLLHPQIYREVLINNSNIAEYHRLIDILLEKHKGSPEIDEKLVFVLMSFNPENHNLVDYYNAMKRAVIKYDPSMKCINLDEVPGSFKISDTAKKKVRNCRLVIVDLTENKPNVFYELGYVHGIAKDFIITAHKTTPEVFYSSEYKTIYYDNATELENILLKQIRGILGENL
jgi:guanylate kinase